MKLDLVAKIPRQKPTEAFIKAANGTTAILILSILFLIIASLIICFGKSPVITLASLIIIGYFIVGLVIGLLQDWIEPIIAPRLFIERSFKVYDYTKYAEFYFKNSQCYLTLVNENNIEIYDVKSGNIIANLNDGAYEILFSPLKKFLLTKKSILHKQGKRI